MKKQIKQNITNCLKIKNSLLGMFCFLLGGQIFNNENDPDNLERRNTSPNFIGLAISYGGAGYFYYDYIEKMNFQIMNKFY